MPRLSGIYGLFGKWLLSGQLKIKFGEISLLKQRAVMLPSTFFVEMYKSTLNTNNNHLKDEVYLWAWKTAYLYIKRFVENYGLESFEERYRWGMDIASTAGLGDYKTIDYHENEFSHFYVWNNPIAKELYPSKKPVDIMLNGINAGGGTACHMQLVQCLELDCEAVNGKRCEFLTATEKVHKAWGVSHLYKDQLDIKYVRPKQEAFLEEVGMPEV